MKKKSLVVQSNLLVEACYKTSLTEMRLLASVISRINRTDTDFQDYEFSVSELAKLLDIDEDNAYRDIQKAADCLLRQVVRIKEKDKIITVSFLSSSIYYKTKGIVSFRFDPALKPYLLQLKDCFTSVNFAIVVKFKSVYSIRIYYLLKQYQPVGKRVIAVDELKDMLCLTDKYQGFTDFKRWVLEAAKKDFEAKNEDGSPKSDITFEFELLRRGRAVASITFIIIEQQQRKPEQQKFLQATAAPAHAARINRIPFEHDEAFALWLAKKGMTVDLLQWAESGKNSTICKASYNDFLRER
jgi:plasmid replication initiation protein